MNKYKVLAGKQIRVRDKDVITGSAKGTLPSGAVFEGIVKKESSDELWVQITTCEKYPQYVGLFGAVIYDRQVFAEVVGQTDPEDDAPVEPINVDLHVVIRDNKVKAVVVDDETWVKQV